MKRTKLEMTACKIAGFLGDGSERSSQRIPRPRNIVLHYLIALVLVTATTVAYVEIGHDKGWKRADVWYTCLHTHHHFPWQ